MAQSAQSITIRVAGDRSRTTGPNAGVVHGTEAEPYLAFLDVSLRADLARRFPQAGVTLRSAASPSTGLVSLKPVEEARSEIGELIGDTLSDVEPQEQ